MAAAPAGGVRGALREVYRQISPRRRKQLPLLLGLMLFGAIFELLTIGAVVPFLALLAGAGERSGFSGVIGLIPRDWSREQALTTVALLFAGLAVVAAAVRVVLARFTQKYAFHVGHDLAVVIFSRMLRQPYSYYVQRNTSEILSGIEKVQVVIYSVILPAIQTFVAMVMAAGIMALLIAIDLFTATIAFASMGSLYLIISIYGRKLLRDNSRLISESFTRKVQQVQEGLGGIRDILLDRSQAVFEESFRRTDRQLRNAQATNVIVSSTPRFVIEAAGIVLIALLALSLSDRPGGVVAAIPVLGALALGAQRMLPMLHLIYLGWSHITGSLHLLFDVVQLAQAPVTEAPPRGLRPRAFRSDVTFNRVSFQYATGKALALSAVDLTIRKGERLGIIGRTGSGKSTLLDLLMGLLEPTAGEMRIDGERLGPQSLAEWQANLAHVPQAIYLADNSIAANVAFGEPVGEIDLERVRWAAGAAELAEFVEQLPDAYGTRVGERGIRLSGGQRQRIGIARALYKRASVLIFDEATSALDDETEQAVMENLSELGPDLTLVMVAHRQSSLAGCTRIVRLDRGRIVEVGSYDEMVPASRRRGKTSAALSVSP